MDQWYDAALGRGAGELVIGRVGPAAGGVLRSAVTPPDPSSVRSAPAVAHRRQPIPVRRLRTFADAQASDAPVTGLIGPGGRGASGHRHPGLPWAGCIVLTATSAALAEIREKAAADGAVVVDMPRIAQTNRVYDDYLAELAETKPEDLAASAVSIIGPRNRIAKLV